MSTLFAWPDWMPRPLQDGYSVEPEDRRLTTQTDAGTIIRREFGTNEAVAECTLVLNPMQAAWFEALEHAVLGQGSQWFEFPLWVGGEVSMHRVRFLSRPRSGGIIGNHTRYEFTLQVGERAMLPDEDYELITRLAVRDAGAFVNLLHIILHVESPGLTIIPA